MNGLKAPPLGAVAGRKICFSCSFVDSGWVVIVGSHRRAVIVEAGDDGEAVSPLVCDASLMVRRGAPGPTGTLMLEEALSNGSVGGALREVSPA